MEIFVPRRDGDRPRSPPSAQAMAAVRASQIDHVGNAIALMHTPHDGPFGIGLYRDIGGMLADVNLVKWYDKIVTVMLFYLIIVKNESNPAEM
jgi:hypothetical protein